MQVLHDRFALDPRVAVLGVHFDDRADAAEYMAKNDFTFPTIANGNEIAQAFDITSIPTYVVISPDREVIYSYTGMLTDEIRDTIERKAKAARGSS